MPFDLLKVQGEAGRKSTVVRHYKLRSIICFTELSISISAELLVRSNKISKSKPKSNASKTEAKTQASKSKPQKNNFEILETVELEPYDKDHTLVVSKYLG